MTKRLAVPLYALYASSFFMLGVQLPFFSGWLALQGFSASEIGLINGAALGLRLALGPLIAFEADRRARNAEALRLVALTLAASAAALSFFDVKPFIAIAAIGMLAAFGVLFPLQDASLLRADRAGGANFGHVRSAGSFAFLLATLAGGEILTRWGAASTAPILAFVGVAAFASALSVPKTDGPSGETAAREGLGALLSDRRFAAMLAAAALVQGAHAAYYAFSILHWTGLGLEQRVIGALWAIGVIVEIVLLWRAGRLAERFRGETLMCAGAIGAVARWLGVAAEPPLPVLFLVQTLHAASFALAYIGMTQFLRARAPTQLLGAAVSLNSTLIAATTGLATVAAGFLFERFGGPAAYLLMTAMAAASACITLYLWRRGRAPRPTASAG
jgi:PPP family 3-phenylpropionic acid transporter